MTLDRRGRLAGTIGRFILRGVVVVGLGLFSLLLVLFVVIFFMTRQIRTALEELEEQVRDGRPFLSLTTHQTRRLLVWVQEEKRLGSDGTSCAQASITDGYSDFSEGEQAPRPLQPNKMLSTIYEFIQKNPRCRLVDFTFMGSTPFRCTLILRVREDGRTEHRKSYCWD